MGRSDEGIILYRNLLKEQLAKVQRGEEPMNVFRDPAAAECIEIVTEHDHARIPGGPTQKYSPIRKTVLELQRLLSDAEDCGDARAIDVRIHQADSCARGSECHGQVCGHCRLANPAFA